MNIKLGVFRLWLVLTFCWVPPVTILEFEHLVAIKFLGSDLLGGNCKKADANAILKLSDLETGYAFECEYNGQNYILHHDSENKSATLEDAITLFHLKMPDVFKDYGPDWQIRIKALAFILLPPLILLILGNTAFWVAAGFLKRETR